MTAPSLEVAGLSVSYGSQAVFSDLALGVAAGEVLAVVGPSGCGKSTLLRAVSGLVVPCACVVRIAGRVASDGERLLVLPEERNLAMVFQDLALWPHLTVARNLELVLSARGVGRHLARARGLEMLERVGLASRSQAYPGELSGGERQRVALARALVYEPTALLLDEPFASLDVALKGELITFVRELLEERRVATLLVTHDPEEAGALADRMAILEGGQLTQTGPWQSLLPEPAGSFAAAFLERLGRLEQR